MYLRSRSLEVEVLLDVGAKIAQIRDLRDGRLWLVRPQSPYRTLQKGTDWTDYDTSGMDDCFPNVEVCTYPFPPWKGESLPQLGEWVYGSWDVVSDSAREVTLTRSGNKLPDRATKVVGIVDNAVSVAYRLENPGES